MSNHKKKQNNNKKNINKEESVFPCMSTEERRHEMALAMVEAKEIWRQTHPNIFQKLKNKINAKSSNKDKSKELVNVLKHIVINVFDAVFTMGILGIIGLACCLLQYIKESNTNYIITAIAVIVFSIIIECIIFRISRALGKINNKDDMFMAFAAIAAVATILGFFITIAQIFYKITSG